MKRITALLVIEDLPYLPWIAFSISCISQTAEAGFEPFRVSPGFSSSPLQPDEVNCAWLCPQDPLAAVLDPASCLVLLRLAGLCVFFRLALFSPKKCFGHCEYGIFLYVFTEHITFNYFPLYAFVLKRWFSCQVRSHPPSVSSVSILWSHMITVEWSCLLRPVGTLSVVPYVKRASLCSEYLLNVVGFISYLSLLNVFHSFIHVIGNFSYFHPTGHFLITLPRLLNPFSFHQASPCSRAFLCVTHWVWVSCLHVW